GPVLTKRRNIERSYHRCTCSDRSEGNRTTDPAQIHTRGDVDAGCRPVCPDCRCIHRPTVRIVLPHVGVPQHRCPQCGCSLACSTVSIGSTAIPLATSLPCTRRYLLGRGRYYPRSAACRARLPRGSDWNHGCDWAPVAGV